MTDQITEAEITEIEARAAAATPGPWGTLWDGQQFQVVSPHDTAPGECIAEWTYAVRTWEPEATADRAECMTGDGVFIAAARTDVPRLAAALRAAYAQLREYESAICFEVTCTGCAKQLDALATAEAERGRTSAIACGPAQISEDPAAQEAGAE